MSLLDLSLIKIMRQFIIILLLCLFLPVFFLKAETHPSLTEEYREKFEKLNREIRYFDAPLGEKLLTCSYFQDLWLSYLHNAKDREEYHQGMQLFEDNSEGFGKLCNYMTTYFNFYTGDYQTPSPQIISVNFNGESVDGFLNTFKISRDLTEEEREEFFNQEQTNFLRDAITYPFTLDEANIDTLKENTVYNFALLPDGTIQAALEKTGHKEYHVAGDATVEEAFQYPNHTIIAGSPHQIVISAGAFTIYRMGDKQLFFISCKSGHFQPTYKSLQCMREQLAKLGVHPATVIHTPTVDMSESVLKKYTSAQIPLSITWKDTQILFQTARTKWEQEYKGIDRDILQALAEGNLTVLDDKIVDVLNRQREESTYMRSAFHLFTESHLAPEIFHQLVKRFGKLKDAIKHNVPKKIRTQAGKLLNVMQDYDQAPAIFDQETATDASFYLYLHEHIQSMQELLQNKQFPVHEYHLLKKKSRELATLFDYLAEDLKIKNKGHFIYTNTSEAFFEINEKLAKAHDAYIVKLLRNEIDETEDFQIELCPKLAEEISGYLKQIGLQPIHYNLELSPEGAAKMINSAKDWYLSHYNLVANPSSKSSQLLSLLKNILNDNYPKSFHYEEIRQLECLKRDAETARNAILFLDKHHKIPEEIQNYIDHVEQILSAIQNQALDQVKENAHFLLNLGGTPSYALEKWECTDQESFSQTLEQHLNTLLPLTFCPVLHQTEAQDLAENVQAVQDLINLYRRNHTTRDPNLPKGCYDTLEEHLNALTLELQKNEKQKISLVSPDMQFHANFILSRISDYAPVYE